MPTYEYECSSCNDHFEVIQSMKDEPLSVCPKCNGSVKRLIAGGMGIIFKGSGFYSTDNKRSSSTGFGSADSSKATTKKDDTTPAAPPTPPAKDPSPTKETKNEKKSA